MDVTESTSFVPSGGWRLRSAGFSMIELAVALVVIAILLGSILVPLNTQVETRKYDETQRLLERAREALLGYAAANGYFPCPASSASNGQEPVGTNHSTGAGTTCPAAVWGSNMYHGFLPATTLGFTPTDANGYAIDAWGLTQNRIRYAVSNVTINGITQPFTRINGMRNAGMSNISTTTTLLYVCNNSANVTAATAPYCNAPQTITLAASVPIVIWSIGPNAATSGGTSTDEAQNPNSVGGSADRVFVSKVKSGGPLDPNEFDDVVTWIGAPTIFNRLIQSGQLP